MKSDKKRPRVFGLLPPSLNSPIFRVSITWLFFAIATVLGKIYPDIEARLFRLSWPPYTASYDDFSLSALFRLFTPPLTEMSGDATA